MIFVTESGTRYKVDTTNKTVTRYCGAPSGELRRDSEPIPYNSMSPVEIGKPVVFGLEPLGFGLGTIRTTNLVISLEE